MKTVVVTTHAEWVYEEVRDGLDPEQFSVVKDYGFDVPQDPRDVYAWWMPGAHAARIQRSSEDLYLTSPGTHWMDRVPDRLRGRDVWTVSLGEALGHPWYGEQWIKPAESKIEDFPAGPWSHRDLSRLANTKNLPRSLPVQKNDRIMTLEHEHRFYMVDHTPLTGSPYLSNGRVWNDGGLNWNEYESARSFAYMVGEEMAFDQPLSYVLDVAFDLDTDQWVVLEANPTWCSGFYGADMEKVIYAIHRSQEPYGSKQWRWVPDPFLVDMASRKRLL